MGKNVEVKAHIADLESVRARIEEIVDSLPIELTQEDIFFHSQHGRLKLRQLQDGACELIFYDRADRREPAESDYVKVPCSRADDLREALGRALGVRGVVSKQRTVYLTGRIRFHLDRVEGLGEFLELEVVLDSQQKPDSAILEVEELLRELGIGKDRLVEKSYIDMLEESRA